MKPAAFSPRTFFIAAVTMVVVLSVGGWSLWSIAAAQYRHVIDGWIDEGRTQGYQISYKDRQVFGFPRHIIMRLTDLHWRNADDIDFRTDDMDIQVTPWDWQHYEARFKGHASVAAPTDDKDHALLISSSTGRAQVTLDTNGFWKNARLMLDDTKLGLTPNYLFQADQLSVSLTRPDIEPKDHTQVGLNIDGEADNIAVPEAMPSPFGKKAEKVEAHMRVMGRVPDVRERADVDAWNKDSGIVEFDDLTIRWGVLDMESKGTVGFDDDLQPEGAFAGIVANPQKTFHALMDQGFIATHDASMLDSAMELFAKPAAGGKGMEFPITVQLGGLFFGPIRIFTFPEIEWPTAPPSAIAKP